MTKAKPSKTKTSTPKPIADFQLSREDLLHVTLLNERGLRIQTEKKLLESEEQNVAAANSALIARLELQHEVKIGNYSIDLSTGKATLRRR